MHNEPNKVGGNIEVATVNINYILSNAKSIQNLNNCTQEIEEKMEIQKQEKKKIISSMQSELNKTRKSLSRKAVETKKQEIMQLSFNMQKEFDQQKSQLRKSIQKTNDYIFGILKNVIGNYAIEKGINVVLKSDPKYDTVVLYSDAKLDISQNILDELNKYEINVTQLLKQFSKDNFTLDK